MIRRSAGILLLILSLWISGCGIDQGMENDLESFMRAFNAHSGYPYSGSILVAKGDDILLEAGYGSADYSGGIPNGPESIYAIGSITKSMTAAAVLQLQEEGLLSVGDTVSKYYPDCEWGEEVTLHHLLTHTSGLPVEGRFNGKNPLDPDDNLAYILSRELSFSPGQDFRYSNAGYQLLAHIVEDVSEVSYGMYLDERLFGPLGMDRSFCGNDASYAPDQSIGYRIGTGDPLRLSIYDFSNIVGSGNVYSTVGDMYRYARGLTQGEVMSAAALQEMFSPQWGTAENGYGYGWLIDTIDGQPRIHHGGTIGGGGYVSEMMILPEEDLVMIFLTNNDDRTALDVVAESLLALVREADVVWPEASLDESLSMEMLESFSGLYDLGGGNRLSVEARGGNLYTTAEDGRLYQLHPVGAGRFQLEDHQWIEMTFTVKQESGDVQLEIRNIDRIFGGTKRAE